MTFSIGIIFKIHIFGTSHGKEIGVIVEGCPPGIFIDKEKIQEELDKRRSGDNPLVTTRNENDRVRIISGIYNGTTTGGPITMSIPNEDVDSSSYDKFKHIPRPGHADYTAHMKYKGFNDHRGSGFFSGRMTASFVMAGSIAKQILFEKGIRILAHTTQIGKVKSKKDVTLQAIEEKTYKNNVRTADTDSVTQMELEIMTAKKEGDSVGGVVECIITGLPVGLGEPIFDSVESIISHSIFSIPAIKGIEFGSGFASSDNRGSENNDSPIIVDGNVHWSKNDAGGILGGITNGADVIFRVAIKPTASIAKKQSSVDLAAMKETTLEIEGRHDPCIVPRAVPVIEAMAAVSILDLLMRNASSL